MGATVSEKVSFIGSQGHSLEARLDRPQKEAWAYGVYSPCFTCTKDILAASRIYTTLAEQGIAMLRVDFTGQGGSQGAFADTTFKTNIEDLLCAIAFLESRSTPPTLLIGHSLGGTAALITASQSAAIKAVVSLNSPANPRHVGRHFKNQEDDILEKGFTSIKIAGKSHVISQAFLNSLDEYDMPSILPLLKKPLLVMHSPQDTEVHISNASELFTMAHHPKSFISLENMDHMISKKEDAQYVAHLIAPWAEKYCYGFLQCEKTVGHHQVCIEESDKGTYLQKIQAGSHKFLADQSTLIVGGRDLGPGPYDFLLSALGACTSMTLRMYAQHKNIPLKKVSISLRYIKTPPGEAPEDHLPFPQNQECIERHIHLEGPLTSEDRDALLRAANKCPIHKTLTNGIPIDTKCL